MSVRPIPVFRAAHLLPYIDYLCQEGFPVDQALRKFQLPSSLSIQPEARLPLVPALRFLSHVEGTEQMPAIAALIADRLNISLLSEGTREAILASVALQRALSNYIRYIGDECNTIECSIVLHEQDARICVAPVISLGRDLKHMTTHFMLLLIDVVRVFLGGGWNPSVLAFEFPTPPARLVEVRFPKTQFLYGQTGSWIGLLHETLDASRHELETPGIKMVGNQHLNLLRREWGRLTADNYIASLKCILKAYLSEDWFSIELAAELSGISVRTMQRNLALSGLTYSGLVENARFEAASEMLEHQSVKIIDIAYAVGYEDPSHFSRAFKRLAGMTPREFRDGRLAACSDSEVRTRIA
jgi:AraC-like DNA-binding protein